MDNHCKVFTLNYANDAEQNWLHKSSKKQKWLRQLIIQNKRVNKSLSGTEICSMDST